MIDKFLQVFPSNADVYDRNVKSSGFPGSFIPGKRRSTDLGWTWKIDPSKAVIAAPRFGGEPIDKLVSKSYKPGFPEEG